MSKQIDDITQFIYNHCKHFQFQLVHHIECEHRAHDSKLKIVSILKEIAGRVITTYTTEYFFDKTEAVRTDPITINIEQAMEFFR